MTITDAVIKNIIRKLLMGEDYRIEVVTLIDVEFLQYAIGFFRRVVDAKLHHEDITLVGWKVNSAMKYLSNELDCDSVGLILCVGR